MTKDRDDDQLLLFSIPAIVWYTIIAGERADISEKKWLTIQWHPDLQRWRAKYYCDGEVVAQADKKTRWAARRAAIGFLQ